MQNYQHSLWNDCNCNCKASRHNQSTTSCTLNFRMNTEKNLVDYFNLDMRFSLTAKLNALLVGASEIYLRKDDTEFT